MSHLWSIRQGWLASVLLRKWAVALMVALWVPLFFFDDKAEKKKGATPIGSGENPPTPPLDTVQLG